MGKRYYDNYDYEEAYKEQCKKLEEAEMERWMKEGWVNCLYRTSTYKSTNTESNTTWKQRRKRVRIKSRSII